MTYLKKNPGQQIAPVETLKVLPQADGVIYLFLTIFPLPSSTDSSNPGEAS